MNAKPQTRALDEAFRPRWRRALACWGLGVDLGLPEELVGSEDLAYIDLRDRRTRINLEWLARRGLEQHVEALFAHEAGHHCRHPQTLVMSTKLLMRQRALLRELEMERPGETRIGANFDAKNHDHLLNLLLDIRINHSLVERYGPAFRAIYARMSLETPDPRSAVFAMTMACYDALWNIPAPHSLVDTRAAGVLSDVSASWREEARALASALERAPDNDFIWLDLYVEAIWPYVVADAKRMHPPVQGLTEGRLSGDPDGLEPDLLEQVLRREGDEDRADREREDRRRPALVELPPDEDDADRDQAPAEASLSELVRAGQGLGQSPRRMSELVRWYYQREAERLEIRLTEEPRREALTPTTLEIWEPDGDAAAIDWSASLGRMPVAIPGLTLLKREYEELEAGRQESSPPWIEIYIDSSGSMPNPALQFSFLAFAGMLLSRAALRAGSMARIIAYSDRGHVQAMEEFSADQDRIDEALLSFLGGGTLFPFALLTDSLDRFRSAALVERVIISDADFFHNVGGATLSPEIGDILGAAAERDNRLTAILNLGAAGLAPERLPAGLASTGIELIGIREWNELNDVAVDLSRRIFGRR